MGKVYLYKCETYNYKDVESIMKNIIDSFDVLKNLNNKTVIIKANLVSAMSPEKSATTHPILIKALTTLLKEKNCKVIIGDSPGGLFAESFLGHTYKVTGMEDTGATLNYKFDTNKVSFPDGSVLKTFEYTSYLDDADVIINFCKLKSHAMMKMSACVKNLFGTIPGMTKKEYHYRFPNHNDFANMLVDLNEYFKPIINIVDAIDGMDGNGPTAGDVKHMGIILAGTSPYETDYICSKLIGLDIKDVDTLAVSKKRNLWSEDAIELNDNIDKYLVKDFNVSKDNSSIRFFSDDKNILKKGFSKVAEKVFDKKPNVTKTKCIGCGKCASVCPAKAITIVNKKAVIDRKKCIKCYCCQEFCPVAAMRVQKSFLGKIINH